MTLPAVPPFVGSPSSPPAPAADPLTAVRRIPGTRSAAFALAADRAKRCLDVLGGIDTLRAGGETYLPKLTGESQEDYDFRLKLAGFFNAPRRLVKAMAGLMFQQDPQLDDAADPALADQWMTWDDRGTHGAVVGRRLAERAIAVGFAGLLTDMPTRPDGAVSRADARRLSLRPYQVPIRYEQINDAEWVMLGAQRVLTYLELVETSHRWEAGERVAVTCYRVFERAVETDEATGRVVGVGDPTVRVWETAGGAVGGSGLPEPTGPATVLRGAGGAPLSAIPFAPFVAGDYDELGLDPTAAITGTGLSREALNGALTGSMNGGGLIAGDDQWLIRSPIQDLIDLALQWYQVYAERRNLTNRVCTQTLWVRNYVPMMGEDGEPKPLRLGASEAIQLGENGAAGFVAPSSDGFIPTKDDLDALERRMAAMGLAFLMSETRAAETAQGKRIDSAAQNATLAAVARELQDCLETALAFHAEYLGVPAPSLTINTDFERITADATMIDALSKLAQAGQITLETLLGLLERWRVLPSGFDVAKEVEELKRNAPPPVVPGATPPGSAPVADTSLVGRMRAAIAAKAAVVPPVPPAVATPPAAAA